MALVRGWRAVWGLVAALACSAGALAGPRDDAARIWTVPGDGVARAPVDGARGGWLTAREARRLDVDLAAWRRVLARAPRVGARDPRPATGLRVAMPAPGGDLEEFDVWECPVMEPGLEAACPDVRTYTGQGVTDPSATIKLDVTSAGAHAQVIGPGGAWAMDPAARGEAGSVVVYHVRDLARVPMPACQTTGAPRPAGAFGARSSNATLRTYRLAMAATASFTSFHGGVAQASSALATIVNRLNQLWEAEAAIRFVLVANNNTIIYTDAGTQPYSDGNLAAMLDENVLNLDGAIGSANFDVGHVVSGLNLGGLATLSGVCAQWSKARAGTGLPNPSGDFFTIRYLSHELGHQFGAGHSFNGVNGNCFIGYMGGSAYEPGAGSTIMSYQGLCAEDNFGGGLDPMFNQGALEEIASFIATFGTCATATTTANHAPDVDAGPDRVVPLATPFMMSATASDPESDPLTFSWEERDLGPAQALADPDNGTSPLFRVVLPTTSPSRSFPSSLSVLSGALAPGEKYPGLARTMTARVTARDGRAGGGGVASDDATLTFAAGTGPFVVTSPGPGQPWMGASGTVEWDPAGTDAPPISCANVRILLSTDNGATFPTVLAPSTPNDGSEVVAIPAVSTTFARVKVESVGNVFYNASGPFTINCGPPGSVDASDDRCDGVRVTWTAAPGAASYTILRSPFPNLAFAQNIGTSTGVTFDDFGAPEGPTLYYWVRAVHESCSSTSPVTMGHREVQAPVAGLGASTGMCAGISLTWNALAGATAYRVYRGATPNPAQAAMVGEVATTAFMDGGAPAHVDRHYWVRGVLPCGESPFAAEPVVGRAGGPPPAPTGLVASDMAHCDRVQLAWAASPGAASYEVLRDDDESPEGARALGVTSATAFADAEALPGVKYFYFVRAIGACGTGTAGAGVGGKRGTIPGAVAGVVAGEPASCAHVRVSWEAASGATQHQVLRGKTGDVGGAIVIGTANSPPFDDATAAPGVVYFYFIRAINPCGIGPASAGTPGSRPVLAPAPTGVVATDATLCAEVGVSWNAATGATGYEVLRNSTNSAAGATVVGTSTGTSFVDSTAPPGTSYYFVRATNACGASAPSPGDAGAPGVGPGIVTNPSAREGLVGGSATFEVGASGDSPTYQWRHDLAPIADGGAYSGAATAALTIQPLAIEHAGVYDVVVTNACGVATSAPAALGVFCPADTDDGTGTGSRDGGVDISDLIYYLHLFDDGDLGADLDDGTGTGTPNGGVDITDLLYYLTRFDGGC